MRVAANPSRLDSLAGRLDPPLDAVRGALADYTAALLAHLDAPNDLPTGVEDLRPRVLAVQHGGGALADLARGFADALRRVDTIPGLSLTDLDEPSWALLLDEQVTTARIEREVVDAVQDLGIPATSLDRARTWLTEHPDVATELANGEVPLPPALEVLLTTELHGTPHDARLFDGLDPRVQGLLGILHPPLGEDDRAPFPTRIGANHVLVVEASTTIEAELASVRAQDAERHHDWVPFNEDDLDARITELERRASLYEMILADNRQILLFDDRGDGRIAELHGDLDAAIEHLAVLVPGTGATLGGHEVVATRGRSFVVADPTVAVVTWLGGDLPDSVARDAPFNHYAEDLGPVLAQFSAAVRRELAAAAPGADLTVVGHSYGGATVGVAELHGLDADRVLHVSSAGAGAGVDELSDYPVADRDRYSLTDDDDLIGATQGANLGSTIGHGADPDDLFVPLETGDYADGTEIDEGAHSNVFVPNSDAWENMLEVITGGEVQVSVPPDVTVVTGGRGGAVVVETPNDPVTQDID